MLKYNTTIMTTPSGKWLLLVQPVDLPDYTLRIKCYPGTQPISAYPTETLTQVDAVNNIWDIYYPYNDWSTVLSPMIGYSIIEGVISGNLKSVTDASFLLNYQSGLQWIRQLDVSGSTTLAEFCSHCPRLKLVGELKTDSATTMYSMFHHCISLEYTPQFNTSNVTDMYQMYEFCTSLKSVQLFDTSSATNIERMFYKCASIEHFPLFDFSSVTNMREAFRECTSVEYFPTFDTSSASDMLMSFYGCTNLKQVPLFDTTAATVTNQMFRDCVNVESGALALYQQASAQENPPYDHDGMFTNCGMNTVSGMAELNQIPFAWGGELY